MADGSKRWIRRLLRPWLTGSGEIGGIIIFSEDITERKKTDAALRESKEMLQLLVENAPVAISMFDREMRYLAASQPLDERSCGERCRNHRALTLRDQSRPA